MFSPYLTTVHINHARPSIGRIFGKKDKQLKAMKVAGGAYVTGPATAMMSNSPSGSSFSGGGGGGGMGGMGHPAYGSVHRVQHVQHLGGSGGHVGAGHNMMMMDNESIQSSDSSYGLAAKAGVGMGGGGPGSFSLNQKKKG